MNLVPASFRAADTTDSKQLYSVPNWPYSMDQWSDHRMVLIISPKRGLVTDSLARGFVATFQAWQKGLGPFLATRLLLG